MNESAKWKVTGTLPEIYEHFVPATMRAWANRLVDLVELKPGKRILDVACGTGAVTHLFAEHNGNNGQIVGYDINPEMLAIAQAKLPNIGIEWQLGNALELPFQDGAFDIVTCQHGLMFFEDRVRGLQEMYRVLAPGGKLLVLVWGSIEDNPGFLVAAEGFGRYAGIESGNSIRGMFVLGDISQMRSLAETAGFQDAIIETVAAQAHFSSVEEFVHGFGALIQPAIDEATQLALLTEITTALQSYVNHEGLIFPMEAVLMHVRK
ncbi:MAG: class I SAM-dependent methyltransferase [Anaerolineae bacterium]|nr:class I SAM-dependent methyltransferase [Anaerolineae bacterium]